MCEGRRIKCVKSESISKTNFFTKCNHVKKSAQSKRLGERSVKLPGSIVAMAYLTPR